MKKVNICYLKFKSSEANCENQVNDSMAMDEKEYSENVAKSLLPEDRLYMFEKVNLVSKMDQNGEVQIEIDARTDVHDVDGARAFLAAFYSSSGSTFNVKSGRADRSGEFCHLRGYRKCMMQVFRTNINNPRRKGLHQDCGAELRFRLDMPKVRKINL